MSKSAAHLVDEVLPVKPVRQWVLSFPIQLRILLAVRPQVMSALLNIATNAISSHLCKKAGFKKTQAKSGSITLIQRFGGSINLNVHFHQIFLDGVYELDEDGKPSQFHITNAPSRAELAEVLDVIIRRVTRYLEKRGLIEREADSLQLGLSDDDAFSRLQAGAASYRFTMGPNKGKRALTLKTLPDNDHTESKGLVVKSSGFSLHAGVAFAGTEREKIEKLCRYIARPAIALERLSLNQRGQVVYQLKRPYDDGTTHIVMTPLELMERLAAIVPRPRVHLTRFAGVFGPHYKHRALVVPKPKSAPMLTAADDKPQSATKRISWARLLKRVFNIDVQTCHLCGGEMKIIAAIEDPPVIKKILTHLGLPIKPPQPWPARGPPGEDPFEPQQHFELQ